MIIFHCWQKCVILQAQDRLVVKDYGNYIQNLWKQTRISIASLLAFPNSNNQPCELLTEEFLFYNEEAAEQDAVLEDVPVGEILVELEQEKDGEDGEKTKLVSENPENDSTTPQISLDIAVNQLAEIAVLLDSLNQTELSVSSRSSLQITSTVAFLNNISQGIKQLQKSQKKRRTLTHFFRSSEGEKQS